MEDWMKEMALATELSRAKNLEEYTRVLGRVLAPRAVVFDGDDGTLYFLTTAPEMLTTADFSAWLEQHAAEWESTAHKLCNFAGRNPDTWAPIIADALPGVPIFVSRCSCCSDYEPVTIATLTV